MSMHSGGGTEPPTRDELRRLEARLDARLQQVSARLVVHDGQITKMGNDIEFIDRRVEVLSERVESRFRSLDERFDSVESRLDVSDTRQQDTHDRVLDLLDEVRVSRRQQTKLTMAGVGSSFATATLCVGAMVVLI